MNLDTIADYIRTIRKCGVAEVELPLVELVRGKLVVVNGHHRIEAFRRLGRKTVVVQYHPSHW